MRPAPRLSAPSWTNRTMQNLYSVLVAACLLFVFGTTYATESNVSISDERAIEIAKTLAECEAPKVECEAKSVHKNGDFEVTISYVGFEDRLLQEWAQTVGTRRYTFNAKRQVSITGGPTLDLSLIAAMLHQKELASRDQTYVKELIARTKGRRLVCGDIGYIDGGSAFDGPAWFVNEKTQEPISTCGGACMLPDRDQFVMCRKLCPPPEWGANDCSGR